MVAVIIWEEACIVLSVALTSPDSDSQCQENGNQVITNVIMTFTVPVHIYTARFREHGLGLRTTAHTNKHVLAMMAMIKPVLSCTSYIVTTGRL